MVEELIEKVEKTAVPFLKEIKVELVDLHVHRHKKTVYIQFLVDRPAGGITVEECSWLNKNIRHVLEEENFLNGEYTLEVSSPGLDRPLKTKKDFLRVMGREVRFHLREPVENKLEHTGHVKDVDECYVTIDTPRQTIAIPLEKINKAIQTIQSR